MAEPAPSRAEIKVAPIIQIGAFNINIGEFTLFGWTQNSPNLKVDFATGETPRDPPRAEAVGKPRTGDAIPALSKELTTEFGDTKAHRFVRPSQDGRYRIERGFVPSVVNLDQLDAERQQPMWKAVKLPNETSARVYELGSAKLIARTRLIKFADDEIFRTGEYLVITIDDPQRGREHFILVPTRLDRVDDAPESNVPEADRMLEAEGHRYILDWPPIRLGDGSYGAVFKVHDRTLTPYALKVLYERQFLTRTGLVSVRASDLARLQERPPPLATEDDVAQVPFDEVVNLVLLAMDRASEGDPKTMKVAVEKVRKNVVDAFEFSQERTNLSRMRFDAERKVAEDIRRAFQEGGTNVANVQPGDYVEAVASTDGFKKSTAHAALQEFYLKQSGSASTPVNLSNYAIVLSYCNFTLKDLLEREWVVTITNRDVTIRAPGPRMVVDPTTDSAAERRLLGYDLLSKLPYGSRVKVILPYLNGVARGLYTLYLAGKSHHDIKPANVFIKQSAASFQALLGDFSFVAQAAELGTTEAVLRDVITTGTIHFRSPEQRDFTEVYQAIVVHGTNDPRFRLRIRDPKFRERKGDQDRLVFSADREGTLYTIEGATRKDAKNYWEVTLKAEDALLRDKFPTSSQPTQVVVYRMPTLHSDLFGFGALAYDLVSGGQSAERFYERLRSVDYSGSPHTADDLIEKYSMGRQKTFKWSKTRDRALNEIFASFGDGEDACPHEFVDLILRCMCQRIPGGLMQAEDAAYAPFRLILKKLERIEEVFRPNDRNENLLINPEAALEWPLVKERLLVHEPKAV